MTVNELIEVLEKFPRDYEVRHGDMVTWWSKIEDENIDVYVDAKVVTIE
ncbi:MAG: hypothetical protein JJE29_00395 [Peptostreptococcaceae bacterium]|nr:hypothetical protein [Peptostreptococcaceae bacterium]